MKPKPYQRGGLAPVSQPAQVPFHTEQRLVLVLGVWQWAEVKVYQAPLGPSTFDVRARTLVPWLSPQTPQRPTGPK